MKPGIIFCAWGTLDLVSQSLAPWIELRRQGKAVICAVSVRFAGFEGEDDGTREYLRNALAKGDIDHLVDGPDNIPEVLARSMALNHLRGQGCDISVVWDSDEVATEQELANMLGFIERDEFIAAWKFSYRNLVFDEKTWLAEPFTPMRAHRLKHGTYVADRFYDDNNIMYRGTLTRDFRHDVSFPVVTIPPTIMNPAHYSWLSNTSERAARSKAKEKYQRDRGWQCSFSWDDSQGGLIFNPALPRPKVVREST